MLRFISIIGLLATLAVAAEEQEAAPQSLLVSEKFEACTFGTIKKLYALNGQYLASQPSADDLKKLKDAGLKTVIDLRKKGELEWDEESAAKEAGLAYHRVPFKGPDDLTDEIFDKVRELLNDKDRRPLMLHCSSANRVAPIWIAHRVLDQGARFEDALEEAKASGLRTEAYVEKAKAYIEKQKK